MASTIEKRKTAARMLPIPSPIRSAATGADAGGAFTAIVHRALTAIGWALESFWKPALAGLVVVLPVWALWRLIRSPFRK